MTIYKIQNFAQSTNNYVCDSQATIDEGVALGYTGLFSIGGETEANAILVENQQAWLSAQADLFCVNKNIITSDGHIEWIVIDLDTEPANNDVIYRILNTPNANWIGETGLEPAKAEYSIIQQNYLNFCGLNFINTWTNWPKKPIPT